MTEALPAPPSSRPDVATWVAEHLGHLCCDEPRASPAFLGGQSAADEALAGLDIDGYARSRSQVDPPSSRGASRLSPYIRHGLLPLERVWRHVDDAPGNDRFRYRSELLWQEYARHWYAIYGRRTAEPLFFEPVRASEPWSQSPWWRDMACIDRTLSELETDGWCVNQTRMWLASQYSLRAHGDPRHGEDAMFTHLLDGSRAANRLGWQWCAGTSRSTAYGFARQQVRKRAPQFCADCKLADRCPIAAYGDDEPRTGVEWPPIVDPETRFGPTDVTGDGEPEVVWLTAESLGDGDPALAHHPDLPVVFTFDEPLLSNLRLSGKRLIFLAETLADLGRRRELTVHLGDPVEALGGRRPAVTYAPVPGYRRKRLLVDAVEYPWPWLRRPTIELLEHLHEKHRVPSFSKWSKLTASRETEA